MFQRCSKRRKDGKVHLPTSDGRTVILPRHTQPEKELRL
jgi:hypothetical protein